MQSIRAAAFSPAFQERRALKARGKSFLAHSNEEPMQGYDVALKLLLQRSSRTTIRQVTGTVVHKWLDVELPKVQNPRADLLGETPEGDIVHLELQSTNDELMPLRMAEYCLGVMRRFGRLPRQTVLYIGEPPLRMASELRGPDVLFRYRAIDVRTLDGDELLESEDIGDNVIAILAGLRDRKLAVQKILKRVIELPIADRRLALEQLMILAGLRKLARTVVEEIETMPIQIDLMENEVIADFYKRGRQEGRHEGELAVLRGMIEKRFGPLPERAVARLTECSMPELEELGLRLLDVKTLEDLLA
jgi:predicted transposase YdaD